MNQTSTSQTSLKGITLDAHERKRVETRLNILGGKEYGPMCYKCDLTWLNSSSISNECSDNLCKRIISSMTSQKCKRYEQPSYAFITTCPCSVFFRTEVINFCKACLKEDNQS